MDFLPLGWFTYLREGNPFISGNMDWMLGFGSTSTAPMPKPRPLAFLAAPFSLCGNVYGAFVLDGASTAASSPRNDLVKNYRVHPTHWLISTQAATSARDVEARATQAFSAFSAVPCSTAS